MADFILDSSTLSGGALETPDNVIEERGRMLQLTWAQGGASQDMEIVGYAIVVWPAETAAIAAQSGSVVGTDDAAYLTSPIEDRGTSIQITYEQSGADQDMEIFGYAINYSPIPLGPAMDD